MRFMISFLWMIILTSGQLSGQNISGYPDRYSSSHEKRNLRQVEVQSVQPLLTTHWRQGCFYNNFCPPDTASHPTCLHVPAGSGAVAMAQIMKFYQYPVHGTGEHGYQHPIYGIQYANFGSTYYNWASMPDSLNTDNDAVATLVYQCAVSQNMNFGTMLSTALPMDVDSALVKYFSYPKSAAWKQKADYTETEWWNMLKAELDAAHPVIYCGTSGSNATAYYFICDGYKNSDSIHFNMCGTGAPDGYYSIGSLMPASYAHAALFNLSPSPPAPGGYVMDFESVPDFSLTFNTWSVVDGDQHDTYGITGYSFMHQTEPMAFLCFKPSSVTPSMASDQAIQPHSGVKFGACFSSNPPSNSDWFISPQVQLGSSGSFSFWVKSYNDVYGLDTYQVAVSTTDNNPASFTIITGTQPLVTTTTWTKKTFNLSAYNNQKVYIAIHCVSNDHFLMMIDDLEIKPQVESTLSADFSADNTSIRVGEKVNFSDQSSGVPTSWFWTFPGGNPSSSSVQSPPAITYSAAGVYPVTLKVSNGVTSDSITKTAFIAVTGYPSTITLDFESVEDFSLTFNPWSVLDVKGGNTYGIQSVFFPHNYQPMAYICFNPAKSNPALVNMVPHSGAKLGCSFSTTPPLNPNDKWLISPKLSLGAYPQIEFWVKTYNNEFGDEKYNVAVSTTNQDPASFVKLTAQPEAAPVDWTKKVYCLENYAGEDVYVGIQCVTNDGFIFMIDDIFITSTVGVEENQSLSAMVTYPNPADDRMVIMVHQPQSGKIGASLYNTLGERLLSRAGTLDNGRFTLDVRNLQNGIYLLEVTTGAESVTRKIFINHQ